MRRRAPPRSASVSNGTIVGVVADDAVVGALKIGALALLLIATIRPARRMPTVCSKAPRSATAM